MDITTKVTGNSLTAAEFMQIVTELENLIEDSGQTLTDTTLDQISKAISNLSAGGSFYSANAVADTYVLTPIGDQLGITAYSDGLKVRFFAGATNTGASTVNVNSLGAKAIVDLAGNALTAGQILSGDYVELVFVSASNHFRIVRSKPEKLVSIDNTDSPYSPSNVVETILADPTAGDVEVNLYSAVNNAGKTITIKKIAPIANVVNINPNGAETIEGAAIYTLDFDDESVTLISDGANWFVKESYIPEVQYSEAAGDFTITGTDAATLTATWTTANAFITVRKIKASKWIAVLNLEGSLSAAAAGCNLNLPGIAVSTTFEQPLSISNAAAANRVHTGWALSIAADAYQITGNIVTGANSASWNFSGQIVLNSKPTFVK